MTTSWRRRLAALGLFTLGCGAVVPAGTVMMAKVLGATTPELRPLVAFGWLLGLGVSLVTLAWWVLNPAAPTDRKRGS